MSKEHLLVAFQNAEAPVDLDRELSKLPLNDMENGERLVRRFGDKLKIVAEDGGWIWWCGTHWCPDVGKKVVQDCAHETVRALRMELQAVIDAGPGLNETAAQFKDRCDAFGRFCRASGDRSRVLGMIERAAPSLTVKLEELDADRFLFNVENGTLVLNPKPAEGEEAVVLKKHDPKDYITVVAPVVYDPEAQCPEFRAFLQRFLPDRKVDPEGSSIRPFDEIGAFVQRAVGYSLTGDIGEQCVFLLHGEGANGKSTLMGVLRGLFGKYASSIPIESLLAQDRYRTGSEPQPEIARLPGKRLAISSEPEPGARLSVAAVKKFTGGEPIPTRQLQKKTFDFVPQFKIWISFNELPPVRAQDHGMWRRIHVIEFPVRIEKSEMVLNYERTLLKEASGILNWALDGFRAWVDHGLAVPATVQRATENYRLEFDRLAGFFNEVLVKNPAARTSGAEMRYAYEFWCRTNGEDPMSAQALGRELNKRGIKKVRSNGVYYPGWSVSEQWRKQGELKAAG